MGVLHGLPMTHKDTHARTTKGSVLFEDHIPDHDDLIVARLRRGLLRNCLCARRCTLSHSAHCLNLTYEESGSSSTGMTCFSALRPKFSRSTPRGSPWDSS